MRVTAAAPPRHVALAEAYNHGYDLSSLGLPQDAGAYSQDSEARLCFAEGWEDGAALRLGAQRADTVARAEPARAPAVATGGAAPAMIDQTEAFERGRLDGLSGLPAAEAPGLAVAYRLGWNEGATLRNAFGQRLGEQPKVAEPSIWSKPKPLLNLVRVNRTPLLPPEIVREPEPRPAGTASIDNLLPDHDTMVGAAWEALNEAETSVSALPSPFEECAVMRHRLRVTNDYGTFLSFGCRPDLVTRAGEPFVLSAYIWLDEGFSGKEVSLCVAGFPSGQNNRAKLERRGGWQRIWVNTKVPKGESGIFPTLAILGNPGDTVHSTAWKLERGVVPSAYRQEE